MITIGYRTGTVVLQSNPADTAPKPLYTHIGALPNSLRNGERDYVDHAANYSPQAGGWDYSTLCGRVMRDDNVDSVKLVKRNVTCRRCLEAIQKAGNRHEQ